METQPEVRHEDPNVREARRHARAARNEMRRVIEAWFPPGVVEHQRAARREALLAVRSLVNAAIDRLDRVAAEDEPVIHPDTGVTSESKPM